MTTTTTPVQQVPGSPLTEVPAPPLTARPTADGGLIVTPARYLPAEDEQLYALVQDGNGGQPLECWPRTAEGAITAINRAAHMSLRGEPVTVFRPDGRLLARFVGGAREGRTRPLRAPVAAI